MVYPSNNKSPSGQLANSKFLGPGCNGWFEFYERLLLFAHPSQWNRKRNPIRPAVSNFVQPEQSSDWHALKTPEQILEEKPTYGVVALTVEQCVDRGQTVSYTPIVNCQGQSVNPAHCDIIGDKGLWPADSLRTARWFAERCAVLVVAEEDR